MHGRGFDSSGAFQFLTEKTVLPILSILIGAIIYFGCMGLLFGLIWYGWGKVPADLMDERRAVFQRDLRMNLLWEIHNFK